MINLEKFKRNKISIRIKEIESELSSTINNKSKLVIIKINSLKKELKTLKKNKIMTELEEKNLKAQIELYKGIQDANI